MQSDVNLNTFPKNSFEALALLFCEKHATSETTAEELAEMYLEARKAIADTFQKANKR